MHSVEANTNFIVFDFGLTRPGLRLTIYRTRDENANHYTIDAVEDNKNDFALYQDTKGHS